MEWPAMNVGGCHMYEIKDLFDMQSNVGARLDAVLF